MNTAIELCRACNRPMAEHKDLQLVACAVEYARVVEYEAWQHRRPRTIGATSNRAVIKAGCQRNNGRYNGNGREWRTPPEIFAPLHAEFGFTLDACATEDNALLPKFHTEKCDGRLASWCGERVFMNPPYGREIYHWTHKAAAEVGQGGCPIVVGLLPASTDLLWWHRDVVAAKAEIRYIRGRVRFLTGGPYRASGFFPSVIVIWRQE